MTDARAKAWATRREKYGERGHAGSYSRSMVDQRRIEQALEELSRAHRQLQFLLPDPAAHSAIDRIFDAEAILEGRMRP